MRASALFLAVIMAAACLRLAPRPVVDEPQAVIDRHVFAAGVDRTGDWAVPRGEKSVFLENGDAGVASFLSLKNLRDEHTLTWTWYGPGGQLHRETGPIMIGRPGLVFDRYVAWDEIGFSDVPGLRGRWTVVVRLDGAAAVTARFEVR